MSEALRKALDEDDARLEKLVSQYPINIPIKVVAEFLGCGEQVVRSTLESKSIFGIGYRAGASSKAVYYIPTMKFVRWYML